MHRNTPSFQIIGAQKCGSTWLWDILNQHPQVAMPIFRTSAFGGRSKESFFFCDANEYKKGIDHYYQRFAGLDTDAVIGEATTEYFYDRILLDHQTVIPNLPSIPELVTTELPNIKIFVVLRNPIHRAISAYHHHLAARRFSPYISLQEADQRYPHLRISERGFYNKYLSLWQQFVPPKRMRVYIFEEDILRTPHQTIKDAYNFLSIDDKFSPNQPEKPRNERRGRLHILLGHHLGLPYDLLYRSIRKSRFKFLLNKINFLSEPSLSANDLQYLHQRYVNEKEQLESLLQRSLAYW